MILEWEQTKPGVLCAMADPVGEYLSLQGSWKDVLAENQRIFEKNPWNTVLARQVREEAARYDRVCYMDPRMEFRITDDGFKRARFSRDARTYESVKRVEMFLHVTPLIPLASCEAGREVISLADRFRFLAADEGQARTLSQMLADILPGTSIANPIWILDLNYHLCIDRSDIRNLVSHSTPSRHASVCTEPLEEEFGLALGAAQEAKAILQNPRISEILSPLGFIEDEGFKRGFNVLCAVPPTPDNPERRRAVMVQNALMCHFLRQKNYRPSQNFSDPALSPEIGKPT